MRSLFSQRFRNLKAALALAAAALGAGQAVAAISVGGTAPSLTQAVNNVNFTPSSGPNIVRFPVGIACEADGQSLVVADAFAQSLIKIDLTTGNQSYLTARADTLDPLSSEPKLDFPTHVAIEADGNYIVTDGRDDGRPRRVIRIDKGTGVASLIVADTGNSFFDQPRGVRIAK